MPNQDGTGPYGDGRSGRGLGTCGRVIRSLTTSRRGVPAKVNRNQNDWVHILRVIMNTISRIPKGGKNA
ncbi:MAG: DUF5320 domain-containing protein [Candidatus Cloacimonetes bacterium]|nr:DUF5320 domain-containing protein [Candidatus Cloacimonadota bacterium]